MMRSAVSVTKSFAALLAVIAIAVTADAGTHTLPTSTHVVVASTSSDDPPPS